MRPDDSHPMHWRLTHDVHDFLARAGDFLRSRPVLHTLPLTVTETLRVRGAQAYGGGEPVFGFLERAGEVRAAFFRTPPRRLSLTPLTLGEADALAARLAAAGHTLPGVIADRDTAEAFAGAWRRHAGAVPTLHQRERLYRLGTLTPPGPRPQGRARLAGAGDRDQLVRWHDDFAVAVGNALPADSGTWADVRIAARRLTLWEATDGAPVSMAGVTPAVGGQIRIGPVYTPAPLRGRGYAGAATYEASRAARAAGAAEVLLFTDLANPTSNGLYQRIGYRPVADFAVYDFVA
ncbi:GNAT family N-acetyltransferase [Streptomyces cavernicola]|uniref:GNAT family N-acetyltransferase n=1 Tax=Streptomyces cavernicola TaxID=3043613 RepID=A0ABT6SD74_9ACTN|nr:GNAT family N-acetyltransferase [Streptomyces sp. B-S-A6]MDI3406143.1 GNAT family N-acetyltransferase [Streptomyces sp. B-S-A6]